MTNENIVPKQKTLYIIELLQGYREGELEFALGKEDLTFAHGWSTSEKKMREEMEKAVKNSQSPTRIRNIFPIKEAVNKNELG